MPLMRVRRRGCAAPCSSSWVPPPDLVALTVQDNGSGMPRETVHRIFNFATRTSDKAVYRSPTRGAQGNALKTVLGIPYALGVRGPLVIEAQGRRHVITPARGPGRPRPYRSSGHRHRQNSQGPASRCACPPRPGRPIRYWGRAFAVFNPHVSVQICEERHAESACLPTERQLRGFVPIDGRLPRASGANICPRDLTSAWWYSPDDLTRLVFSHIAASQAARRPGSAAARFCQAVSQPLGQCQGRRRSVRRCQGSPISAISTHARHRRRDPAHRRCVPTGQGALA